MRPGRHRVVRYLGKATRWGRCVVRRRAWLYLVPLTAALGAVGCEPVTRGGVESTPGRQVGGTLRLQQIVPPSLDPYLSDSVHSALPINQIFDTLVARDPSLNLRPSLAQSWTIDRAGRVFRFQLRRDVQFQDGSPFTADDVVFTLRRLLLPREGRHSFAFPYLLDIEGAREFADGQADTVRGISRLDRWTVEIRLHRSNPAFLSVLAMDGAAIVSRAVVEAIGDVAFGRDPIGTGPFRIERWSGDRLVLVRNPDYFRGAPLLERVEVLFTGEDDPQAQVEALLNGDLHLVQPSQASLSRLDSTADVTLHRYQELTLSFLGIKTHAAPLSDPLLRRAIALAVDRERLVADAPLVRRDAVGVLPPGIVGFSVDPKAYPHDPQRSRLLLAEAGFPGGEGLPVFDLYAPIDSNGKQSPATRIQQDLNAIGLRVEIRTVDWPTLIDFAESDRHGLFLLAWIADHGDPDAFLRPLFAAQGSSNYFHYSDASTELLLRRVWDERNSLERRQLYEALERRVLEMAPIVPLYHTRGVVAMRPEVRDLRPGPLGLTSLELESVWLFSGEGA